MVAADRRQRSAKPAPHRRSPGQALPALGDREPSGGRGPVPEAVLLAGEQRAELLAAVNGLREEERLVIVLRYFLDLSEAETAAALDVRPGTVKSRTARALARLRAPMQERVHA